MTAQDKTLGKHAAQVAYLENLRDRVEHGELDDELQVPRIVAVKLLEVQIKAGRELLESVVTTN